MSHEAQDPKISEKPVSGADSKLIELSGFKVAEIADILGRSRQAIYQGLSGEKPYFGVSELSAILNTLVASDSPRTDAMCDFIEANYPSAVCDLVLPDRISLAQLTHAAEGCERLFFAFNENTEHALQKSLFIKAFSWAHDNHLAKLCLISGNTWLQGLLADQYGLRGSYSRIMSSQSELPLAFVLIERGRQSRLFYFGRRALGEADQYNATMLSNRVAALPLLQQSAKGNLE